MPPGLVETLPEQLDYVVQQTIGRERIEIRLRGKHREALVCTTNRLLIVKAGFHTGNGFGSNTYQLPYANITGCDVHVAFLNNYFEVSAGGMQNQKKLILTDKAGKARVAMNCVSLESGQMIERFRQAVTFVMQQVYKPATPQTSLPSSPAQNPPSSSTTVTDQIEKLWKLKVEGALTLDEFDAAKKKILAS